MIKACGSNDIYEVSYKEIRYILKIYSKRACWRYNKNHYLFELNLQNFLQKNGIIVPSPLQNKKRELISEIQVPEYKKIMLFILILMENCGKLQLIISYKFNY